MRVIEHLSLATNVCTLYNKGVVNIPFSCCEKEGEDVSENKYIEKMLNCLVVPNNFLFSELRVYAVRGTRWNVDKGLIASSLCLFLY